MSFSKSPMSSDLVSAALLAASIYETTDTATLIKFMTRCSNEHEELSKILNKWLSAITGHQPDTDLYFGITILFYQEFILKANSLGINIYGTKLEFKQTNSLQQTDNTKTQSNFEKKEANTPAENKASSSLTANYPLSSLDEESLNNLENNFFKYLSDGEMLLSNGKRYTLKQNTKGLLMIERGSYLPIKEAPGIKLMESLKKLDFLKSIANCFTSEKIDKGIDNIFRINFSEEASRAIMSNCKLTKEPLMIFGMRI